MSSRPRILALLLVAGLVTGPAIVLRAQQPAPAVKDDPKPKEKDGQKDAPKVDSKDAPRPETKAPQKAEAKEPAKKTDVEKIIDEGMNRSEVMATLGYLSDVIGPRLTGSPGLKRANEWTRDTMKKWGLENAHLEPWGPFGRGWTLKGFSAEVVEPLCIPLIAYPKAWSPGTHGRVVADVVHLDAKGDSDFDRFKGQLRGKFVLTSNLAPVEAHFDPLGKRHTDTDLLKLADAPLPGEGTRQRRQRPGDWRERRVLEARKLKFALEEGALGVLTASSMGDGGTIFVAEASVPGVMPPTPPAEGQPPAQNQPVAANGYPATAEPANGRPRGAERENAPKPPSVYDKNGPKNLPQVAISKEHYNRILRMLAAGEPVKLALDLAVEFQDVDPMAYNTVAEIPGTDLKDEVVMLGGHLDSWHAGTGATDNGAGCAVAMEAARIIKAQGLKPRRTIRVGLWSGEEQGLFGSKAYVTQHFGEARETGGMGGMFGGGNAGPRTPKDGTKKPEYDRLSAYYNLDNGSGKIRGVYLQGNEDVRPIFRQWLAPFREMGASTLTPSNTGGTDHLSFDGIGLPGFQFIQDEIEYDTRTHHSNQDVFDRAQADDLKQASVIMAAFVYQTANRDAKLPRKGQPAK